MTENPLHNLTLNLAIATHGPEGLKRVESILLPQKEGITYIVSWQNHENKEIPEGLKKREDVRILRLDKKGLSNNRNNAIDHCEGDIILFADDDMVYSIEALDKLRDIFEKNPDVDLALFKVKFSEEKSYPSESVTLGCPFPKDYYVSSVEIAVRRKSLGDLRLYPALGLGSESMLAGEDEFFVASAIRRGLKCRFFPLEIGRHPDISTGSKISPGIMKGQGFVMAVIYPRSVWIRVFLKSYRNRKNGKASFRSSFVNLIKGVITAKRTYSKIPSCYV